MNKIKEEDIVQLIRAGQDRVVVELLYKKVLPLVKKFVLKNNGNNDDALDIFHDAIMLFFEQVIAGNYNEKYKVYGFVYKISTFRWINKCKKDKNLVIQEELPEIQYEDEHFTGKQTDISDSSYLKTLFGAIGEKCIELLNYTIYTDMLMEDIMVRMGFSSVDAVRMQQMRCKQKLIKEIEKNPSLLNKLKNL